MVSNDVYLHSHTVLTRVHSYHVRSDKNRQHVVATGAIAARSRRSRSSLSNVAAAAAAVTSKRNSDASGSPARATRPAPPRPDSAARSAVATSASGRPRPLPTAQKDRSRIAVTPPLPLPSRVPAIQVQAASPSPMLPPIRVQTKLYDDTSAPSSPNPGPVFDSSMPPVLPIQIPEPGDEAATQQFYRDVVNHLQTISQRSSLPPTPLSPTQAFFLTTSSGGSPSNFDNDPTQFEDADEDDSDAWTSATASPFPNAADSQFVDRAVPTRMLQPAVMMNQAPPLVRPPRVVTRASSREQTLGRVGSSSRSSQYSQYGAGVKDKENVRFVRGPPPALAPRPAGGQKRATLGLAIQSAGVPTFDSEPTNNRSVSPGLNLFRKKCKLGAIILVFLDLSLWPCNARC